MLLAIGKSAHVVVRRIRCTNSPTRERKNVASGVKHVLGKGKEKGKVVVERKKASGSNDKPEEKQMNSWDKSHFEAWACRALGLFSFLQLLGLEIGWFVFLHWEERKGVRDWIEAKDPVAGTAFLSMLMLFGIMPGSIE